MSAMVWKSGWTLGSHMIICGLMSRGVTTASVGCLAENCTAESVNTKPSVIDLSRYIWALVCWKPIAGPHLDLDAGVLPLGHQRPGDPLLGGVELVAGSEELVGGAVLGLGPPVGLDHHGVGADALQALRAARGRRVRAAAALRRATAASGGNERQAERGGQQRKRAVPAHGPPSS